MRTLYDVAAPAKLNLFLHVLGQRPDGYHLLQSAFMLIDWCDTLHFERRPDGRISREDLGPALPTHDLVLRAARALQQASGCTQGVHIRIDKHIPTQAGLGGGSSNAATSLLALNRLWQLGLSRQQLADLGLGLGADVPFFVHGRNAWVEGIGERIQPLTLPAARFVVLKPQDGLSTAEIFSHPQLKRDTKPATISVFAADPFGFGENALESVADMLCASLQQGRRLLAQCGLHARMTGSGSALFAQIADDTSGDFVMPQPPEGWLMRTCSNLPHHPLLGWAD